MKRNVCFALIFVVLVVSLIFSCNSNSNSKTEEYLYKINSVIKDMDFYTAKADDNKIILYNTEQEMIKKFLLKIMMTI